MISVAANFNAEPLGPALRFWFDRLGWSGEIRFAGYNQVLQQLADPRSSFLCGDSAGNVILVRHEDWLRFAVPPGSALGADHWRALRDANAELIAAVDRAARMTTAPFVVVVCPPSASRDRDPSTAALLAALDDELDAKLGRRTGVSVVRGRPLIERYRCSAIGDPRSDELGHVPYTSEYYAVLATAVARSLAAQRSSPRKVVVVDCDNTLWGGVVGEEGADGVRLEPGHLALQRFLIAQQEQGALLCLCSKNDDQDVWSVFDSRADMVLRREHIVAWRINWQAKSQNLAELAEELGLGLDSFVFLDDDAVQCAEVRTRCPSVIALQIPSRIGDVGVLLDHLWALDRPVVTAEDRQRTELYRVERSRRETLLASTSLAEFLAGLDVRVDIADTSDHDLARASQLTMRTNQFNVTTIRRSEPELRQLLADPAVRCLSVRVSDRFGDYGMVGLVIAVVRDGRLEVDSFLLSCRVLGRAVEHRVLAFVGQLACDLGLEAVAITLRSTPRNRPAREFIEATLAAHRAPPGAGGDDCFLVPADVAAGVTPEMAAPLPAVATEVDTAPPEPADAREPASSLAVAIAELSTGRKILDAASGGRTSAVDDASPGDLEGAIATIICEQLCVDGLDRDTDFYELGGDSLKALQVLARIREVLRVDLPLDVLLDPTLSVATIASWVDRTAAEQA